MIHEPAGLQSYWPHQPVIDITFDRFGQSNSETKDSPVQQVKKKRQFLSFDLFCFVWSGHVASCCLFVVSPFSTRFFFFKYLLPPVQLFISTHPISSTSAHIYPLRWSRIGYPKNISSSFWITWM